MRACDALTQVIGEAGHVESHIELRYPLQSNKAAVHQILRRLVIAHEQFQIGCGELNEALKEIALFGLTSRDVPEALKDFMAFPPVGVIVEIDSVTVII